MPPYYFLNGQKPRPPRGGRPPAPCPAQLPTAPKMGRLIHSGKGKLALRRPGHSRLG